MMMARLTVLLLRMQHMPIQNFHTDRHHCQRKQHREKLSDFPNVIWEIQTYNKTMRNRVVAFSIKVVAVQKEKPGNALFIRLPRLVAPIRTRFPVLI